MRALLLVALVRPSITKNVRLSLSLAFVHLVQIVGLCVCYICVLCLCVYIYKLRFLVRFGELARSLPLGSLGSGAGRCTQHYC